tara:strand:+ start:95 stop:412 length:318 start_codon:yes stop_codon:yes gene_type:complete
MYTTLPIYETIINKIDLNQSFEIESDEKIKLIEDINNNVDTHEIVFVLIRIYQINNSNNVSSVPYQCKFLKTKKGYKFDLDNIPNKLIYILQEFYKLHYKSISDK